MRHLAPFNRLLLSARAGLLLASALLLAGPGWSQTAADLEVIRTRAAQGDPEAQNALGNAHTNGLMGLQPDMAEALKWYRQAGGKGFAPAQFNLGLAHEMGRGVPVDERQAFKFYLMAAEQGYAPAQFNTGNMYSAGRGIGQDYFEANLWYKQAADNGLMDAQFNLGFAYETGRGVKKDEAQAARWYGQAANRGYPRAQYNLGILLEDGRGISKDAVAAAALYKAAAEQGFAPAQLNYGLILSEGRPGVPRDPVQALVWLSRAVQNGANPEARDALVRKLTPDEVSAANLLLGGAIAVNPVPAAATGPDNASTKLIEQLREQSRRLAGQVEAMNLSKEEADRQTVILTAQVKDLQQELQKARAAAPAPVAPAVDVSRYQGEIDALATKLGKATDALKQLEQSQAQLTEANQRLQQENASLTAAAARTGASLPDTGRSPIQDGDKSAVIANLQRDNARLNDEVKRSTLELLSLNQQLRNLRSNPANAATAGTIEADAGQAAQLTARAQLAEEQSRRLEADNQRLTVRLAKLENTPKPVTDETLAPQLALARQTTDQLQHQLRTLQGEKAELDKWSASLETALTGKTASVARLETTVADLEKELVAARSSGSRGGDEVGKLQTDLAAASLRVGQLGVAVEELIRTNDQLQKQLDARPDRKTDESPLRDELAQAQARIAGLQRDLNLAKQQLDDGAQLLEVANQVVEKSTTTVADLTAVNQQLEKDLAAATRGSEYSSTQRDEITQARRDLEQTQARVAELEKQLADALTVRTRGGDDGRNTRADIDEANRTVEKLNTAVAELTAANDKLEQDLDNAQRSTAAALAAQSQAVSAASPDAYQMEIGTLNARIKQLDSQVEEERANSAREVTTLAAQMQRLRETNKSLTDANRALLSAKDNDTAATRDDIEQLQGRIRELTSAGEELRLSGQKQAADLRSLIAERDGLKSELVDAHKVATALPGLTDDKVALQERLEAVGGQLVQLQQTNAELTQQLATSRQANEKAQSDLVALQAQASDAEKAAESHNMSVGELTQANARLELEQEDMRRLVESYRADITRLTQTARSAEQQKAEAERSGQQNIDAVTAQLGQLRREVEAGRTAQARLTENFAVQDRDRAAVITQLRNENSALAARLNQAQSTLDQIASAARLGTPAATIASGGLAPVRSVATVATSAPELRYHTVAEGDSLSRISMRYYGTPNRWQEIFQSNRDVLQGSSVLRVGMQLRIP